MHRSLINKLNDWQTSPGRRPLLLRGARQVGKTYLVDSFAKKKFSHFIKINFEKDTHYKDCFASLDVKKIIQEIELHANQSVIPGKTLLFLDEIQDCPSAIMALRYFYEEMPELHIIGAGSLLEFALSDKSFSMPVGRVSFLYLHPMSFMEVLSALGEDKLCHYLNNLTLTDQIPLSIHNKLLQHLKLYFVLGGMPYIVDLYVKHKNLLVCREAQTALLNSYRSDFGKYATLVQQGYCERVFSKSLAMIATHFRYKDIDPDLDYRGIKQAIRLLFKANVLSPIFRTNASGLPLSATQIDKHYKVLFLDVGLVQAAGNVSPELILQQKIQQLNQGALTEQYAGQHLLTMQQSYTAAELFYWKRDAQNSQAEIDYIFAIENALTPIEVKSGASGKLRSLHIYMKEKKIELGVKLSTDSFDTTDSIWSIPLYMIEQLSRLVTQHQTQQN
jgi:uncharacterized protein